jgi:2-haloacid dehalogenase
MPIDRRAFVTLAAAALAAPAALAQTTPRRAPSRAVAFDGLVIFDVRRALALSESAFPRRGAELVSAWRQRQFEYQWLRASGERYADFLKVTDDSLEFAARSLGLALADDVRAALLDVYREPDAWPDALPALRALKENGLKLALLSNMTPAMLRGGIERAGLAGLFDSALSTDAVHTYKPAPRAYGLAPSALEVPTEDILFVASAAWDVAGAKWFGYRTYWLDRGAAQAEVLDAAADGTGRDMRSLVAFLRSS